TRGMSSSAFCASSWCRRRTGESAGLVTRRFGFFFFQAEDGIRDGHVTGVQTCALPIYARRGFRVEHVRAPARRRRRVHEKDDARSEERRVGKGVDLGGRRTIKKKKKRSGEQRRWYEVSGRAREHNTENQRDRGD